MTFEIAFETACGVILVLLGFVIYLIHLAQEAQKERQMAQQARDAADGVRLARQMTQAQIDTAPTDAGLEDDLARGTF